MWKEILLMLRQNFRAKMAAVYFGVISVWWVTMYSRNIQSGTEADIYTNVYGFLALWGGVFGFITAKQWGGLRSAFGRALSFISFGLLAQFLGQISYNTYIYVLGVEVPYPSFGDIWYFGSVIFYIIGIAHLFRVVGSRMSQASKKQKFLAIILPLILLLGSYFVFLKGYDFASSDGLATILDFAYPLGQAVYVSLALLVFLLSRSVLGGIMRQPMVCLLFSLVFQYFCDYIFLYQAHQGTWHVAGINDYMYFASYFFMTLSLSFIARKLKQLRES